jgi:hypothetical protein
MARHILSKRQNPHAADGVDDDTETSTPADRTLDVVNTTTQDETIDKSTTLIGDRRLLSIGAGHELSESSACSGRTSFAADDEIQTLTFADNTNDIGYNASFISCA